MTDLRRQLRIKQEELEQRSRELAEAQRLLQEDATRYSDLYDSMPVGYCSIDPSGRISEINLTASALLGVPREELVGRMFATVADLREKAPFLAHLRRCSVANERTTTEIVLRARAGRDAREIRLVSDPIRKVKGEGAACRTAMVDITDLKVMERRMRLLADAGALLATSLSPNAVLETAQRILVPALADVCLIDLASESSTVERAAIVFADPEKQSTLNDCLRGVTARAGWRSPQAQVIASGEPMLLTEMPAQRRGGAEADDDANALRRAGVRSLMVVPLAAHGRSIGAVTLAAAESGRLYSRADLGLARELAGRVAVALDNARLYDEAQRMNGLLLGGAKASGIVAISPDAIISVDERSRITLWNDGAEKMYGYSREEAIGLPLDVLIPERYRAAHRALVRQFASGRELARKLGRPNGDIFGLRKNGEEFPADTTISKLELRGEKVLTVSVRDVTDQRRIESEQRTLARLGQAIASSLDFDDTLTQVVRLVAEELGDFVVLYLIAGASDQPAHRVRAASRHPSTEWYSDFVLTSREDAQPNHPVSRTIATKQPLLLDVTPAVLQSLADSEEHARALGMLHLRSIMVVPLIIGERCLGALLFKSASRAYGERDLELTQEIGRRTALLIENAGLHKTAQHAINARDNILRVVAHDLRNPLAAIALEAAALLMVETNAVGAVHDAAAVIRQCVTLMKRMIQDLLDADRIESGRLSVTRANVPVAAALTQFVRQQKAGAAFASLELEVDVTSNVGTVFADPDRLFQVLENLVSNAERFTPRGGRITIGARRRAPDVEFWVSDTGTGMEPAALAHVFDQFSTERRIEGGGTGYGLPIVKGIVEAHEGHVWAESRPGAGSTFYFTMPLANRGGA